MLVRGLHQIASWPISRRKRWVVTRVVEKAKVV